jgi:hypothetical protein
MDPVRNPYAPGAGQRPPELAGRDNELGSFDVVLERVSRGRAERSIVLTGLRGVGKTVLLNALRSAAVRAGWGTGKFEARPEQSLRRPLSAAVHLAIRELGVGNPEDVQHVLGILRSFAQKGPPDVKLRDRWQPGIEAPIVSGRADSGDIEIDLVELFGDVAGLAADAGRGVAIFIDEMQDLAPADVSALCAACHELSQNRLPLVVVGAGLPHLPTVLSASKSYSERLFRYARIDRLNRESADHALRLPARTEDADFTEDALAAMYEVTAGYPYFIQAYGKAVWDVAPRSPITVEDVQVAAPEAEAELAVGFFGSRFERATPAERDYLRGMALAAAVEPHPSELGPSELGPSPQRPVADLAIATSDHADDLAVAEPESVLTSAVAEVLGRKPQSLSPARDSLLKKGLIYSGERGRIAFTVPHFGRYLRAQPSGE